MDRYGRLQLGAALAIGLVLATVIGTRGLVRVKSEGQTIDVTGSAKRRIRSDLAKWTVYVYAKGDTMQSAYHGLAAAVPRVRAFLDKHGVKPAEIKVHTVDLTAVNGRDKEGRVLEDVITGYKAQQNLEISSGDVDRITQLSLDISALLEEGLQVDSGEPEYHYTKLGELKIEMLHEAAKDTRVRAEKIADATRAKLGPLRSARMGIMQINPADSTETSSEGNVDHTSIDKDVIAVVTSSFQLE